MNFNLVLEQLKNQKRQCSAEARNIKKQKNIELENVTKQITEKYSAMSKDKYHELEEHNNKIDAYCQMIETYSYFDERQIGYAIASLMRIFEGRNFIYQDTFRYATEVGRPGFDTEKINVRMHPRIVVSEAVMSNSYSDDGNSLSLLVKNGKAIVLVDDADTLKNGILFYRANTKNHRLEECASFGEFSYIKEFVDSLISYKIEKNLKNISDNELERLKLEFISARINQIRENYQKLAQQQEEQMKQELAREQENRELRLRKVLDKIQN